MNISKENLEEFAKGKSTQEEHSKIHQYLLEHPEDTESVFMMMDDDLDLEPDITQDSNESFPYSNISNNLDRLAAELQNTSKILPMTSMAAQNSINNLCVIHCEGETLRHFGYEVSDEELLQESTEKGWLQSEGTALFNIGRLCGAKGLNVATLYNRTIIDIQQALNKKEIVIAVIDSQFLDGNAIDVNKTKKISHNPNHAVIVDSIKKDTICIQDSASSSQTDDYLIETFVKAWEVSAYNLVIISDNDENYEPHPIELDDIELTEELVELREAIAENAHEVWAYNRKKEGWNYGPVRDDKKKTNPDLIPYNRLPESEKLYDREMAMNTIKLVNKLGWEVKRKNE